MGKWIHRLTDVDDENQTATCAVCGPTRTFVMKKNRDGGVGRRCRPAQLQSLRKGARKHLKASCEWCGFVPAIVSQLEIDHIDEDVYNNDPSNLQTLCANCHRLKTFGPQDEAFFLMAVPHGPRNIRF